MPKNCSAIRENAFDGGSVVVVEDLGKHNHGVSASSVRNTAKESRSSENSTTMSVMAKKKDFFSDNTDPKCRVETIRLNLKKRLRLKHCPSHQPHVSNPFVNLAVSKDTQSRRLNCENGSKCIVQRDF